MGGAVGVFGTILVANRGEIACRVIRTLRRMGIRAAAVYSDADAGAPHVRLADIAVRLGPPAPAQSYLDIGAVLAAAERTDADAVHPGYGFLSENPRFARACTDAGLVFIGPPAGAIESMGDKIAAKTAVAACGVPVVPGRHRPGMDDAELSAAAEEIGYPLLVKAAAGGGGRGLRVVRAPAELAEAIASARREAAGAFDEDTLLLERYIGRPRHIEVQVLADTHGAVLHLGERECSLQRRHQKIVEECPSPLVDEERRRRMGDAAVRVARACGYVGAGTVEFLATASHGAPAARDDLAGSPRPAPASPVDADAFADADADADANADAFAFYFLEMNTRLQVEHPVTEEVYGIDLVEWQVRIAAGEGLPFRQSDLRPRGHAVEARIYAEDPAGGFLPTGGTVLHYAEPEQLPGVRVDSGVATGTVVGSVYDPLLAKVIGAGPDRRTALRRLDAGLRGLELLGVKTNAGFVRALLATPDVRAGRLDTALVERQVDALTDNGIPSDVLAVAGAAPLLDRVSPPGPVDPFDLPGAWRVGRPASQTRRLRVGGRTVAVRIRGVAKACEIVVEEELPTAASLWRDAAYVHGTVDGVSRRYVLARDGGATWIARDGVTWVLEEEDALAPARAGAAGQSGPLLAPMPGTVTTVRVTEGQPVAAGEVLIVVEAMKMEHPITAPGEGVVVDLRVAPGDRVALDEHLLVVEPALEAGGEGPAVKE